MGYKLIIAGYALDIIIAALQIIFINMEIYLVVLSAAGLLLITAGIIVMCRGNKLFTRTRNFVIALLITEILYNSATQLYLYFNFDNRLLESILVMVPMAIIALDYLVKFALIRALIAIYSKENENRLVGHAKRSMAIIVASILLMFIAAPSIAAGGKASMIYFTAVLFASVLYIMVVLFMAMMADKRITALNEQKNSSL